MGKYYMMQGGKRLGPLTPMEMVQAGMTRSTMVWQEGMDGYVPASSVQELRDVEGGLPPDLPDSVHRSPPAAPAPPSRPTYTPETLSPGNILLPAIGWPIAALVAIVLGEMARGRGPRLVGDIRMHPIPTFIFLGLLLWQAIIFLKMIYRGWTVIQGPEARTSPANAVAFLFIPIFNFYWAFVAIPGLAKQMNAYMKDHGIKGPAASEGKAMALLICTLLAFIPIVGVPFALATLFLLPMTYNGLLRAGKAIVQHQQDQFSKGTA